MITEDEVVEEKTAEVPQVRLSPEVICQGFSNELKKLTLLNKDSPRIFMVYAHSPYGKRGKEDHANSNIAKQIQGYLNPTNQAPCLSREGHLKLNLYSDLAPQGNGSEPHNQYKEADVLYSQMCLLPKHPHSVDYVILCGSRTLHAYSEIKQVQEYTNYLRKLLSPELSKEQPDFNTLYTKAESALATLKIRCEVAKQRFHHLYTELAFLILRKEEKDKDILPSNDLITMVIDRHPASSSSAIPHDLQNNSIYIGTAAWAEKDPKALYIGILQLLSRLFGNPKLGDCRVAIDKAYQAFTGNINLNWTAEDATELAEQYNAHQERKSSRQRNRAKLSFAPSSSSEEDTFTQGYLTSTEQLLSKTKALHNTATVLQTNLGTPKSSDKEKKQAAPVKRETEHNTDNTRNSANHNLTLIAKKKVQGDIIHRGYNPTYTAIPTNNHLDTLSNIHTHQEKQMQGFSGAYLEAEEVGGKIVQEFGNETIAFASSASPSTAPVPEIKANLPTLRLSDITPIVSSASIFPSPVKSNRLFVREIRNFLGSLNAVYKADQDIHELCEEINVLIGEYSTKEDRDRIREKIEEIYFIQKDIDNKLASTKKNELDSPLVVEIPAHEGSLSGSQTTTISNSLGLCRNHDSSPVPPYDSELQAEKEKKSVSNTQNLPAGGKAVVEARIQNQGTIGQLNQLVGNTMFFLPTDSIPESVQTQLEKILHTDYSLHTLAKKTNATEVAVKLKKMCTHFISHAPDELHFYIPLEGTDPNHSTHFDLETKLQLFLEQKNPGTRLLMGQAGAGKTSFCQHVMFAHCQRYLSEEQAVIPLYIYLPLVENPTKGLIEKNLYLHGFTESEIAYLKKEAHEERLSFFFILDAYDEARQFETLKKRGMDKSPLPISDVNLWVTNQLEYWKPKALISCRSSAFEKVEDATLFFKPYIEGRIRPNLFEEWHLIPFSPEKITQYITQYIPLYLARCMQILKARWEEYCTSLSAKEKADGEALFQGISDHFLQYKTDQAHDWIDKLLYWENQFSSKESLKNIWEELKTEEQPRLEENWLKLETFEECLNQTTGLRATICTPFLLRIAMEILPETAKKFAHEIEQGNRHSVEPLDLYEQFVERFFNRQREKLIGNGVPLRGDIRKSFRHYSIQLAQKMEEKGVSIVEYESEGEEEDLFSSPPKKQQEWALFFSNKNPKTVSIREGCPLYHTRNHWFFWHDTIRLYFLTKGRMNILSSDEKESSTTLPTL